MKKIAKCRGKPDICSYARSFDYRKIDTKIIREVFNSTQDWVGKYEGVPFPIRADDCFNTIYKIDSDDLDDIYSEIAKKLNININNPEKNPYWNKVNTVKDLVMFLHFQKIS
ncbi:MAG: hypothetical protein Q9M50_10430 [Methylococcales bacterium]|nr:hypothetical protein [Methylococcales bacterium]